LIFLVCINQTIADNKKKEGGLFHPPRITLDVCKLLEEILTVLVKLFLDFIIGLVPLAFADFLGDIGISLDEFAGNHSPCHIAITSGDSDIVLIVAINIAVPTVHSAVVVDRLLILHDVLKVTVAASPNIAPDIFDVLDSGVNFHDVSLLCCGVLFCSLYLYNSI
jgi:hypothetical protein